MRRYTKPIGGFVDDTTYTAINDMAQAIDRSVSYVVREALRAYIIKNRGIIVEYRRWNKSTSKRSTKTYLEELNKIE